MVLLYPWDVRRWICLELFIGGQKQGKLAYVLSRGYTEADVLDCAVTDTFVLDKKVIDNLQELIRRLLIHNQEPLDWIENNLKDDMLIICNEVGSGIVPMDRFERAYRDAVGDVCCALAKKAETVERICCGIPIPIKVTK